MAISLSSARWRTIDPAWTRLIAAILAAMPAIVAELTTAGGQRLVAIQGLAPKKRYEIIDPRRNPPKYWPR